MSLGIPLTTLDECQEIAVTVDGADEVDPKLRLIKGGGGALLREKIVASATKQLVIVADASGRTAGAGEVPAAGGSDQVRASPGGEADRRDGSPRSGLEPIRMGRRMRPTRIIIFWTAGLARFGMRMLWGGN